MKDSDLIVIENLKNKLGDLWVHRGLNLTIKKGEILGIIGNSGSGKTTLIRSMILLQKPIEGSIKINGINILNLEKNQLNKIRQKWGVLFQQGALFSSLTVQENVIFPLRMFTNLPHKLQKEVTLLKIAMVGLPDHAIVKYPNELSGGMLKRTALARAIALDPEVLFLDEPTAGLDPHSAAGLSNLILELHRGLKLTVVMVTHDIELLSRVTKRVAFLGEGKVLAIESIADLKKNKHPLIQEYFADIAT